MARRRTESLTDGELRIMRVLWNRRRATVSDIVTALPAPRPAYNTVLTMLRILERKGYVSHEKDGRAFAFLPLLDQGQARRRAITHLLKRFFDNSAELLVLDLVGRGDRSPDEIRRIRALIAHTPEPS